MNINQLMNSGANVSVVVSLSDLREFVAEMIAEADARPQEVPETFLNVQEVCKLLNVSSNTLWRWNRNGYLKQIKVGRTPMYKQSDIDLLRNGKRGV